MPIPIRNADEEQEAYTKRLAAPEADFEAFAHMQPAGVIVTIGKLKGSDEWSIASVNFDKKAFDLISARQWMDHHHFWANDEFADANGEMQFTIRPADNFDPKSFKRVERPEAFSDDDAANLLADLNATKELGQTLSDVEIFRVGTWNGDKYTGKDLDDIVASFDKIGYRPPVKLGHKEDSGDPAYGWVASLKRVGDRLVATFEDIPDKLFQSIKDRQFDTVSSEIFWNIKRNGSTFRRALKAVAILGAEIPAVADLKPLRDSVEAFTGDEMSMVHSYTVSLFKRSKMKMPKNLQEAVAQRTELQAALKDEQDAVKVSELQSELLAVGETIEAFTQAQHEADLASAKAEGAGSDADAVKVASLTEEVEAMRAELAQSREATRREKVTSKVADLTIPALRPHVASLYDLATKDDVGKVAFLSVAEDGEKKTSDVDPISVVDDLVDRLNKYAAKLFSEVSTRNIMERDEDLTGEAEDPGVEVDRRAKAYVIDKKVTYSEALHAVCDADPALAARYNA
jgi:hypothetical protein